MREGRCVIRVRYWLTCSSLSQQIDRAIRNVSNAAEPRTTSRASTPAEPSAPIASNVLLKNALHAPQDTPSCEKQGNVKDRHLFHPLDKNHPANYPISKKGEMGIFVETFHLPLPPEAADQNPSPAPPNNGATFPRRVFMLRPPSSSMHAPQPSPSSSIIARTPRRPLSLSSFAGVGRSKKVMNIVHCAHRILSTPKRFVNIAARSFAFLSLRETWVSQTQPPSPYCYSATNRLDPQTKSAE